MYPAQQNATDQTANFFWLLVIIFGAVIAIWWFERFYVVTPVFWLRHYEIELVKLGISAWKPIAHALHLPVPNTSLLTEAQHYMEKVDAHKISFDQFAQVNRYVGYWVRYPFAFILLILAGLMYFRHGSVMFRKEYNMETLKKNEVQNWPQIQPVLSLNLVKQDLDEGPWAMAKLPLDFAKEHGLVHLAYDNNKRIWQVNKGAAHRIFAMQVGQLWRGVDTLPIQAKALVVVFLACANKKREVANKYLSQIAASAASGKLDFSGVEEELQQYKSSRILQWLEKRHAYTYTLMMSLLEIARTDGVLATAEFLWLKPVDRHLWYALNSVGRQASVVEIAGTFAHWRAEKKIQRPLKMPMVKEAVKALELDMQDTLYIDESERWHSNAA